VTTSPETHGGAAPSTGGAAGTAPDPVIPDLLPGEAEQDLRATVRAVLAERAPLSATLARCECAEPYDPALWRVLARDVGCAGLAIPAKLGGADASWREVAVVAEELGRAVAPTPFLGSAAIATAALLALRASSPAGSSADTETEIVDTLAALGEGTSVAALAVSFAAMPGGPFPTSVHADASGRLAGTVTSVADASTANTLLLPVRTTDGAPALYAVDHPGPGVTLSPVTSLDLTRPLSDIVLESAPARLLTTGEHAQTTLHRALAVGAGILAAEQLGIAEACLEMTVGYLKTRRQFGRLIGSYQALKHRAADLWSSVAQARAVARYAAVCLATGSPDTPQAVAIAQAYCSGVAVRAAEECVQLHGGIGFTWEHPAHLYLKRAKADALALGTAQKHRAVLGDLVGLALA